MRDPVAVRLNEIRAREKLSFKAMADAMAVDVGQLYRALDKEAGIGRKMLDGAIRAYPEIADVYARSLTTDHDSIVHDQHLSDSDGRGIDKVPQPAEVA